MDFSIEKDVLLRGLSRIQTIIEKRTTIPILSNVLIEAKEDSIILVATDLEVGIKALYPAATKVPGKIALSAKKLYEIVKEFPEKPISFKVLEKYRIEIHCAKAVFRLAGFSPDQFPHFPDIEKASSFSMDGRILKEMVDQTSFSMSTDESKYNLSGIFFHALHHDDKKLLCLVATDGHRLAMTKVPLATPDIEPLNRGVILPRKGALELRKIIDNGESQLIMGFVDNNVIIVSNETTIVIRLVDGEFPDYQKVIPPMSEPSAVVSREAFLRLIRRVATLANEKHHGVKISLSSGQMEVTSSHTEFGEALEKMEIEYDGEAISIGFNARYLIDILNSQRGEKIRFQMNNNLSPGLITPVDDQTSLAVVMPMRL